MNNSKLRISKDIAADVFALAAQSHTQQTQDYSLEEMIQAGGEVEIPPEFIVRAVQQIKANQIQARERQQKLKLILISGSVGAALMLLGVLVYNMIAGQFTHARRSPEHRFHAARFWRGEDQNQLPPDHFRHMRHHRQHTINVAGEVQQYLFNPEGKADGLLLNNGLQVKFPPFMGDSLMATVSPGTQITILGTSGFPSRFGQEIRARSITNAQTGQTLMSQTSPILPQPPNYGNYSNVSVEGTAQHWLVGHRGNVNGVVLSNGAVVRFPPHASQQLQSIANVGDKVKAEGFGTRNDSGQTVEATTLTINGQSVPLEPQVFVGQ
ncbi:MAG: hypothetical protein KME46_20970 [Brasilonema angustatum HA4187-MV1]|jgi:hypothetical protein|nr:hypothetical protein [Brasilonema angustatum HA4187-MV1]